MTWEDCKRNRFVKEIFVDKKLIKSLIEISDNKIYSVSLLPFGEKTYSSIIVLYYDSLRELLEALSTKEGYKIYNHECYTHFLKEILNKSELAEIFNRIRMIRNSLVYYGKRLSLDHAEIIINDLKLLIKQCTKMLEEFK